MPFAEEAMFKTIAGKADFPSFSGEASNTGNVNVPPKLVGACLIAIVILISTVSKRPDLFE